ncbi:uncharacterized protein [Dermacentor albipictus]|uniref:uncharacterized protein isoform X1 n=1 Tax=Dermacentor albipictus TaxID=60249 RepID=UPI0031FC3DF7
MASRWVVGVLADPCEDFHAYACHPTRRRDRGQPEDERRTLQRVLLELSLRNDSDHVATQAATLFKSCLGTPLSLEVVLQQNMLEFLNISKLTMETALGFIKTPHDIANFSSLLWNAHGIMPFMYLESGRNETIAISFSRPFSAYLNTSSVYAVLKGVTQLFETSNDVRSKVTDRLVGADRELAAALTEVDTFHLTIEGLAATTEGDIAKSAWQKIIQAYSSRNGIVSSSAATVSVESLKRIFTVLFDKLAPREAAIYSMAHALLPTQVLAVLLDDHRIDACFRLIGDTLGTSWRDLESYLLGFFDENHEAQSVADSLVSTLEKMLRQNYALDKEKAGAAVAKLKKLRLDMLSVEGLASILKSTACRGNVSDRSLYRNVIQCRGSSQNVRSAKNDTTRRRERSSLSTTTILLPVESFKPSSFCHGRDNLLNYATLGTDLASRILRYVSEPLGGAASSVSEAGSRETLVPALTTNVSTCLSKKSTRRPLGKVLEGVASQMVAFQVALQASKSHASVWSRLENAADAPAWKQTYFVKYCQRLCSKAMSDSFTAALDAALVCNLVVMNSPEFAQLFACERGDPMVPSEYCLAL